MQIALAFLGFILIGANDGAFGVLLPSLQSTYAVDKATVGLLFLAGTAGYLSAAFLSGLLVEKLGQRVFLMLGAGAFALGAAAMVLRPPFVLVPGAIYALGLGVAVIDAGLNAYVAALPRSTALLNYLHAFYGVGALLGPLVASTVLAIAWGWNTVYVIWAAVGLALVIGFGLRFARPPAPAAAPPAAREPNVLAATLRQPVVGLAALFLLFYVGTEVSLGTWTYSLLTQDRHLAALPAGWLVSGYWMGLTVGRLVLARPIERVGSRRAIEFCLGGLVLGVLLVWLGPGTLLTAAGLWLTGFSLGPIFPTTIDLLGTLVPARLLPSAIGFVVSAGSVGAAFFPWLAGTLAQSAGMASLLPYVIVLTAASLLLWWALRGRPAPAVSVAEG